MEWNGKLNGMEWNGTPFCRPVHARGKWWFLPQFPKKIKLKLPFTIFLRYFFFPPQIPRRLCALFDFQFPNTCCSAMFFYGNLITRNIQNIYVIPPHPSFCFQLPNIGLFSNTQYRLQCHGLFLVVSL